jgi:methylmalonyl-CoA/ethylmalonyl-CoA epimerase
MLTKPEKPGEGYGSIVYFKVADIHGAHAALNARGVAFEREPHLTARMADHDLWMAFFRDLDGNLLALMCEAPRA